MIPFETLRSSARPMALEVDPALAATDAEVITWPGCQPLRRTSLEPASALRYAGVRPLTTRHERPSAVTRDYATAR
jgi:glycerol-3-phosphate dehydrogenase